MGSLEVLPIASPHGKPTDSLGFAKTWSNLKVKRNFLNYVK